MVPPYLTLEIHLDAIFTVLFPFKGLTTGGLPTFIDVGNSFGAPAIVEDNLIHQVIAYAAHIFYHDIQFFFSCSRNHLSSSLSPVDGSKWKASSNDGGRHMGSIIP